MSLLTDKRPLWIIASVGGILAILLIVSAGLLIVSNIEWLSPSVPPIPKSDELTYVDTETVSRTLIAIDQATSLSSLESVLNDEFMYKEYESEYSLAGAGVVFITADSAYIIDDHDILRELPYAGFSFLSEEDLPTAKKFSKWFVEEVSKYPKEIGKSLPFFGFAFIKDLKTGTDPAGGTTSLLIYYDIILAAEDEAYARTTIHHEIAHMLDSYGLLSSEGYAWDNDPQWDKFNANKHRPPRDILSEHPRTGFVTGYAMTNNIEDKAETLAYLLECSSVAKLNEWRKTDNVLMEKANYLLDNLGRTYLGIKDAIPKRAHVYGC